jgi:hypothetical protein
MASAAQIDHSGSGTGDRANDQAAAQIGSARVLLEPPARRVVAGYRGVRC